MQQWVTFLRCSRLLKRDVKRSCWSVIYLSIRATTASLGGWCYTVAESRVFWYRSLPNRHSRWVYPWKAEGLQESWGLQLLCQQMGWYLSHSHRKWRVLPAKSWDQAQSASQQCITSALGCCEEKRWVHKCCTLHMHDRVRNDIMHEHYCHEGTQYYWNAKVNTCAQTCIHLWLGEVCSHVAAWLFKVEACVRLGYTNPACASMSCEWNEAFSKKV